MSEPSVVGIDPGPTESALVVFDGTGVQALRYAPNEEILALLRTLKESDSPCVIEQIASYGMPVGAEVFETCVWTGRFMEAYGAERVSPFISEPRDRVVSAAVAILFFGGNMNTQHPIPPSVRALVQPAPVRIDAVKPYSKNTLQAFVDFTLLDAGLSIKGAGIHEKEGQRWLSLPSREYAKDGEKKWIPVVEFASREARDRITSAVLAAFDQFSAGGAN